MNMGREGYIKLHRSIKNNPIWKSEPFTKAQAWVDILLEANHSGGGFFVRGIWVELKRGQTGRSELTMSDEWRWSRMKTRRFLEYLQGEGMIEIKRDNKTTVLTVCNYETYQCKNDECETPSETTERHQKDTKRDTNNNVKNVKNKNKHTYSKEFESCWDVHPDRNGMKQGKKSASELFEKLSLEDKRKVYVGSKNYAEFINLPTTEQNAMDLERFIRKRFFEDYQGKIEKKQEQIKSRYKIL